MASGAVPIPTDIPIKYLGSFGNSSSQKAATVTIPRGEFYILIVASAASTKNLVALVANTSAGVTSYDVIHQNSDSVLTISTDTDTVKVTTPNNQNKLHMMVIPTNIHVAIPSMAVSAS